MRPYDGRYYGSHEVTVTVEDVGEISGAAALSQAENFEGVLATYTAGGTGGPDGGPNLAAHRHRQRGLHH